MVNKTDIMIRLASPDDVKSVEELVSEVITELHGSDDSERLMEKMKCEISEAINTDRDDRIFVALQENTIVGCGRARVFDNHPMLRFGQQSQYGYIELMFIKTAFRGRRLGIAFLNVLEHWKSWKTLLMVKRSDLRSARNGVAPHRIADAVTNACSAVFEIRYGIP